MKLRLGSLTVAALFAALFAALALTACGGDSEPEGIGATASATDRRGRRTDGHGDDHARPQRRAGLG